MKTSDIFNGTRFIRLFRQNLIHYYRMILISLIGVSGGIFILLILVQLANKFQPWMFNQFLYLFIFLFISLGTIFIGTSFPGLRSREKSYSYILTPASAFEKFLFEFISRPVLFILSMPLIYWIVYTLEGNLMHILNPDFIFNQYGFIYSHLLKMPEDSKGWIILLAVNAGLLFFIVPFAGAASFMKHPLLKTYFVLAIFFFFHLFLVYFYLKVLGFAEHMNGRNHMFLFMESKEGIVRFLSIYLTLINLALLSATYFKLKEKEA